MYRVWDCRNASREPAIREAGTSRLGLSFRTLIVFCYHAASATGALVSTSVASKCIGKDIATGSTHTDRMPPVVNCLTSPCVTVTLIISVNRVDRWDSDRPIWLNLHG
ncbi:hypothetical protein L226DRAFT_230950 [Lentinus tigrinus ALCF2SS1-7]|uniref:uncharacterized protein n=1 Tax=Lentinus tigrinus ALCF2SS1-7 TaxID=1328758 RepID=UPI0011660C31|nr:hypothetical protein L226DRAFT_230950 [Lentinus tigrinus ALCF2SS1-7]